MTKENSHGAVRWQHSACREVLLSKHHLSILPKLSSVLYYCCQCVFLFVFVCLFVWQQSVCREVLLSKHRLSILPKRSTSVIFPANAFVCFFPSPSCPNVPVLYYFLPSCLFVCIFVFSLSVFHKRSCSVLFLALAFDSIEVGFVFGILNT